MGVCVSKRVVNVVVTTSGSVNGSLTGVNDGQEPEKEPVESSKISGELEAPIATSRSERNRNYTSDLPEDILQHQDSITQEELKCREVIKKVLLYSSLNSVHEVMGELEEDLVSEINMFIFTIPKKFTMSVKDLAQSLIASGARYLQPIEGSDRKTCIAKYYAIYAWISGNISVDIQAWKAEINGDCSNQHVDVESVLENCSSTGYGFALLFSAICKEAGLAVELVKGNIRRWQCTTGDLFEPSLSNSHFWNMVKLQNSSFIVDTMMGSGYVSFSLDFIKEFNSHYFAVPTNYSILTHWPEEMSQQYLETPISLQDVQPLIPVDVTTIHLGIIPFCWCESIPVSASDPVASVIVELKQSNAYIRPILLPMFQEYDESVFQNLVYVKQIRENLLKVYAVLPSTGIFILNIYLQNSPFQNKIFLSYILTSKGDQCHNEVGYPFIFPMSANSFNFKLLKWNSEEQNSYLCKHTKLSPHSIDFEADQGLSFHHCIVEGKHESLDDIDQTKVLLYNTMLVSKNDGKYQLFTIFPNTGWWTIHLSAGKVCDENGTISGYTKLLTYTIYVENGNIGHSYPQVFKPDSVFFGSDPVNSPTSEPLKILFESTAQEWVCSVSNNSTDSSLEGYAIVNSHFNKVNSFQLLAIFPKPGTWFVLAYGRSIGDDSYTAMFKIKLCISEALPNKCLIRSFAEAKHNYQIHFADSGIVSFYDNGKPFSFSFKAPSSGIQFLPTLKHQERKESIDFATFLSSQTLNSEQSEFNLSLLFPEHGCWTTEIYARSKVSDNSEYSLVATLNLSVTKPTPEICYPKVLPFFHDTRMVLKEIDALIQVKCTTGKLKLPFQAPTSTTFLCNLENEQCPDNSQLAYVQHTRDTEEFNLNAVFPELGEWKVSLYARVAPSNSSATNDYTQVLQFPIANTTNKACVAYPQIFDGFYKFKIYFADEDIPLPSVVSIGSELKHLLVKFYCPRGVSFLHYATVRNFGDPKDSDSEKRRMTTIVSDRATRARTIQVDVDCPGEWIVYLFAETKINKDAEWMPVLKYRFMAKPQK